MRTIVFIQNFCFFIMLNIITYLNFLVKFLIFSNFFQPLACHTIIHKKILKAWVINAQISFIIKVPCQKAIFFLSNLPTHSL
eukprot:TRINITY_DN2420_c0_g1_i1.p1 TRINITY_DN2420_c0_g1~~TRINITY_DN2420_c0_g1_i1.p1  ORF type:complete len:82 (+),score=1.65 TRINITY_DN2420_c0_g1_i1:415-660(+)